MLKKEYTCKLCGWHDSPWPLCNKCMTLCPECNGKSWDDGRTDCDTCYGAGAAMPGTKEEQAMFEEKEHVKCKTA